MSGRRILLSIVGCLLASASLTDGVAQSGDPPLDDGLGTPLFTTVPLNATPPTDNTIPHWTSSFTSSQVTYPFSMVGTNPALGNATTIVPVAIIPVMFVFSDGQSLDGTPSVADVLASPIFQNFGYTSGTTQFGDAILRAQFWPIISTTSPDWHVLLGNPTVYPTQVIDVPPGQGLDIVGRVSHRLFADIDPSWFGDRVIETIQRLRIAPTTLAIFHTYNSFLVALTGDVKKGGAIGFHFATRNSDANGNQVVQTGIVETWIDPVIFRHGYTDIHVLSHEVSEWLNDPFGDNPVPPWALPGIAGTLGLCQGNLETGDFISYLGPPNEEFPITLSGFTYHPQNEALLQWFSRELPSSAIGGAYSYPDTTVLTSPSPPATAQSCPPKP